MAVSVDEYRPGLDDPEVLELRAAVWGKDHPHTSPYFLEWLFQANPFGKGSGIVLRNNGKLVGFAGLVPRRLRVDGEVVPVAFGLDYMVDPGVRGAGLQGVYAYRLASSWAELAARLGFPLGVCFPNANSFRILTSQKLKWTVILTPRLLIRPLPGLTFRGEAPAGLPPLLASFAGRAAAAVSDLLPPWNRRSSAGKFSIVEKFDGRFDELWNRARGAGVGFCRDSAYLNWRYINHPLHRYRVLALERDGRLLGFLVSVRRDLFGLTCDLIVDALWEESAKTIAVDLLDHARGLACSEGVDAICTLAKPGTALYTALRAARFWPIPPRFDPKPFFLTGLPLSRLSAGLFDPAQWDFTWGDMDVV